MENFKLKNLKSVVVAVLLIGFSASPLFALESKCTGPTSLVKVTVKQIAISPPFYLYTITNLGKSPIVDFTLGIGEQREMQQIPDNIPISVGSPQVWDGYYILQEGGEYMHIFWLSKHKHYEIAPSAVVNGFTVIMPKPMEKKESSYNQWGKLVVPLDMKKAPFVVSLKDGTCVWGRVITE